MNLLFIRKLLVTFLIFTILSGCANTPDFREGTLLLKEGKIDAGVEYRIDLQRQREIFVFQLLGKAESDLALGHYAEAEASYIKILQMDAMNQRAQTALQNIQGGRKLDKMIAEAASMYASGSVEDALNMTRSVLMEMPQHRNGKALQQKILEKFAPIQKEQALKSGLRKRASLEFRDASFKFALAEFSKTSGIHFILDKDVRPDLKVTLFIKDTPIEDVLNLLMVTNQLEKKILSDNTVLIYPNTAAKTKEYQELSVKSFYLANADAKQTLNMIKTMLKTKDVFIDEKLNLLMMRDTPEVIRLAEKLIAAQDMAEPEVTLDVEVLEVKRSKLTELGIQYPNSFTVLSPNTLPNTTTSTTGGALVVNTVSATMPLTLDHLKGLNSSQIGISNPALNLRDENSDTNMLANPSIRVRNREKAKIHIGEKVPVITTTSTANVGIAESVSYLDVGLKLDVEPNIYLNNDVAIKIALEVSNIVREIKSASGTLAYQVGTRNAATVLRLKDGETQALAGLISEEDRRSASRLPGLGDLPLLGHLFSSQRDDKAKTEIILLITPHIVRNLVRPNALTAEFSSGTESVIGSSPLRLRSSGIISIPIAGRANNESTEQIAVSSVAQTASINLIMPQQVAVQKEFTANLNISANYDIKSAALEIVYDPGKLLLANFQEGPFMKQGGVETEFYNESNEKDGRLKVKLDRSSGGAHGAGTLLSLVFRVVTDKPDITQVKIENQSLTDITGIIPATVLTAPNSLIITP